MKKNILLISFILLSMLVFSQQEYYPIPEENTYWTTIEFDYYSPMGYNDFLYTVNGDTMVNGLYYTKVFKLDDYPTIYDTISTLHCLMRQDSAQKKVWFIRTYLGDTEELLGYDLNVEIGDTVNLPAFDFVNFTGESRFILMDTEYVDIQNIGEMNGIRKHYWFRSIIGGAGYNIEYYEGIMNRNSLFPNLDYYWGFDAFHQTFTWCMQQDGVLGFIKHKSDPPETWCGFEVVDVERIDVSDKIKINPNPASNYFNIEMPSNLSKISSISIYNLTGQKIESKIVSSSSKSIMFDVSTLINGIYLLHINMNDMVAVKKIVVNH